MTASVMEDNKKHSKKNKNKKSKNNKSYDEDDEALQRDIMSSASTEEELPRRAVESVNCPLCGRGFARDRIQVHTAACEKNAKERKVYNIAQKRIEGTEAEELFKTGMLTLPEPRPNEKKSVLHGKLNQTLTKDVLPPIAENGKDSKKDKKNSKTTAYQVVFDQDNNIKTKKSSKLPAAAFPPPLAGGGGKKRLPTTRVDVDQRFLSAERARGNWQSAGEAARPGVSSSGTLSSLIDEDEDDYLASSQKSKCSDAFDFLFDSQNLNHEKSLRDHPELERYSESRMEGNQPLDKNVVTDSACCVVS